MTYSIPENLARILDEPLPMLMGGELVTEGDTHEVINPTTKSAAGRFVVATDEQVDDAVAAAKEAASGWAATLGHERADVLLAIRNIVAEHGEDLIGLDAVDVGKPLNGSRYSDLPISLESLSFFAGKAQDLRGASVQVGDAGVTHRQRLEPYGVVLEVLPWNGPLWTGVQRLAAILAAGNVAIIKPAELATASFTHLARLIKDVVPAGVVSVLPGPGSRVGARLAAHPDVAMVSLTGGTETGSRMLADLAPQVKRVSLELGGKNPNLVLANADIDKAVRWSSMGAFANSGQVCVCGSRILVHRSVYDEFTSKLAAAAQELVVGNPLDASTTTGPVVGGDHYDKIWSYIDAAKSDGSGTVVTGGERYSDGPLSDGWFIPPTVFADVVPTCAMFMEEIFGPVVSVTPFDEIDEALALANATDYGLAAGVFTESVTDAAYVANNLQAGQVYVNQWFAPGVLQAPSHGYKRSGYGGVGIEKYLQVKNIFTRFQEGW